MCEVDPSHDGPAPPPGESWCPVRLDIELVRWFIEFPMECGPVKVNAELL